MILGMAASFLVFGQKKERPHRCDRPLWVQLSTKTTTMRYAYDLPTN